ERIGEPLEIDHADRGDKNAAQRLNWGKLPHRSRCQNEAECDVLSPPLPPEVPKGIRLPPQSVPKASMRNCYEHAGFEQFDFAVLGILRHHAAAFSCQFRFQGSGNLVKPGMDDAAVETGCFPA